MMHKYIFLSVQTPFKIFLPCTPKWMEFTGHIFSSVLFLALKIEKHILIVAQGPGQCIYTEIRCRISACHSVPRKYICGTALDST